MFSIAEVPEKTDGQPASCLSPGFEAGPFLKESANAAGV